MSELLSWSDLVPISFEIRPFPIEEEINNFLRLCILFNAIHTEPGHKSLSAGSFLKQNYHNYRLCEQDIGGSNLL